MMRGRFVKDIAGCYVEYCGVKGVGFAGLKVRRVDAGV